MKIFKVALCSDNTASWSGFQMDANYTIDLKTINPDLVDYDKPYKVTFNFKSISATSANSSLTMTKIYALCLDFGKGYNTYQYRQGKNYSGLLTLVNDFTVYTSTACNIFFDTKETDNAPLYLPNIQNINNIRLNVIDVSDNSTLPDANKAFLKYCCILTFEQL